jgi:hypothetical protein
MNAPAATVNPELEARLTGKLRKQIFLFLKYGIAYKLHHAKRPYSLEKTNRLESLIKEINHDPFYVALQSDPMFREIARVYDSVCLISQSTVGSNMDTALQNQAHRMPQAPDSWLNTAEPDIAERSARQRVLSYWSQAEHLLNQSINLPWRFAAYAGFSSNHPSQTVRPTPQIIQTLPTQQAPSAQQLIPPTRPSQLQVPLVQRAGPPAAIQISAFAAKPGTSSL